MTKKQPKKFRINVNIPPLEGIPVKGPGRRELPLVAICRHVIPDWLQERLMALFEAGAIKRPDLPSALHYAAFSQYAPLVGSSFRLDGVLANTSLWLANWGTGMLYDEDDVHHGRALFFAEPFVNDLDIPTLLEVQKFCDLVGANWCLFKKARHPDCISLLIDESGCQWSPPNILFFPPAGNSTVKIVQPLNKETKNETD